jgi:hypothetical protein
MPRVNDGSRNRNKYGRGSTTIFTLVAQSSGSLLPAPIVGAILEAEPHLGTPNEPEGESHL